MPKATAVVICAREPHPSPSLSVQPIVYHMPFTRQPPPSPKSSRTSYPPLPLDHTPSSSSSIPSLTSEGSSSSESEALASPLGQLSLGEEIDSPPQTRKPQVDPAIQLHDREMVADGFGSTMRENKVEQESRRDQRSIHSDVDTNVGQEVRRCLPWKFRRVGA
ncbi:hypothetical protein BD310DRAFT_920597 [Dichomitus squalens]|uniref:Uncharacterized protein n=1 Tax=Dichomitus squalens TaxID=114155 RepID=A0A4Q9Q489_9APHY|nr:hypothetical protein BD310DRAFT_920597 [Dichomitus squalens]